MESAAQRTNLLIDQCFMWCVLHGIEPYRAPSDDFERTMLRMAVHQTKVAFKDLNKRQRRVIAGMDKS